MTRRELAGSDSYNIWHFCGGGVGGWGGLIGEFEPELAAFLGRRGAEGASQQKGQGRWWERWNEEWLFARNWQDIKRRRRSGSSPPPPPFHPSFHHTHTHTLFSPSTIANYQICWLGSVHLKLSVTADGWLTGPFIQRCPSCRWERNTLSSLLFFISTHFSWAPRCATHKKSLISSYLLS